ncbi:MAG: hypothetical protein J4F30_05255 [Acidobacteria bacterium]|nr:hypothetical protein [Acidobacteriota bacterium]
MMLTIVVVGIVAMILLFSIYLREDVKFSVRFWGTGMSLEVRDQHAGRTEAVTPGYTRGDLGRDRND